MPRSTVSHGFVARGWKSQTCTALQAYTVAGWLGVGYTTLIHHMRDVLNLIPRAHAEALLRVKPKQIRAEFMGRETSENVIAVDTHWTGRPIDMEVGDLVMLPPGTAFEGNCVDLVEECESGMILRGVAPGEDGRVASPVNGWSAFLRVRHREAPDHVSD
jgi:hypothetical protein